MLLNGKTNEFFSINGIDKFFSFTISESVYCFEPYGKNRDYRCYAYDMNRQRLITDGEGNPIYGNILAGYSYVKGGFVSLQDKTQSYCWAHCMLYNQNTRKAL